MIDKREENRAVGQTLEITSGEASIGLSENSALSRGIMKTPAKAESVAKSTTPAKKSWGETLYEWIVYSGISYWTNLAISLVVADYFTHLSGRKHLDNVIDFSTKVISFFKIPATKARGFSKVAWETLAMTSGGIALLIPMKLMEDHKRPMVHWLNKVLGIKQVAADGHELTADEIYIEKKQPHQSWWNVVKRRIYASIVIIGSSWGLEHTIGRKNITDFIVGKVNKAAESGYVPGGHWFRHNERAQRYLAFAALDTIFTRINAIVMHLTNGAKKMTDKTEAVAEYSSPHPVSQEKPEPVLITPADGPMKQMVDEASRTDRNIDAFKSKKIVPSDNHVDLTMRHEEPNHMMAV